MSDISDKTRQLKTIVYLWFENDWNRGSRDNVGRKDSNHVDEAIYVGAVGARFERKGKMEYQDIYISRNQNVPGSSYFLFKPYPV